MKRIPLKIAAEYLSVSDARTVKNWCRRHGVTCFKDGGWYVFEDEFLNATMQVSENKPKLVEPIKIGKYTPQTDIAKDFEKQFAHIPAA